MGVLGFNLKVYFWEHVFSKLPFLVAEFFSWRIDNAFQNSALKHSCEERKIPNKLKKAFLGIHFFFFSFFSLCAWMISLWIEISWSLFKDFNYYDKSVAGQSLKIVGFVCMSECFIVSGFLLFVEDELALDSLLLNKYSLFWSLLLYYACRRENRESSFLVMKWVAL